jgi:surface polysaccharide O-acyltransferase-like enzyme
MARECGAVMQAEERPTPDGPNVPVTPSAERRYDVDWLRTIAIGLLVLFHVLLTFQSWAASSGFPQNEELLEELVPFISMLTVWRIPLLFMISGMGVRFAMERRDWRQLLKDRAWRILVPYLFGIVVLDTLLAGALPRLGWAAEYAPNFGHLWFLLNIFLYVLWLIGIMVYMRDNPANPFNRFLSGIVRRPLGLLLFAVPLMVEAWLTDPEYFSMYIDNIHGWLMGLICFFWGFVFISAQDVFWPAVARTRWVTLLLASSLYLVRLVALGLENEWTWLVALESMSWMLAILGFGSLHLNRPSRSLGYLSRAVYPVYIVHLPVQFAICYFLLPLSLPAHWKLGFLLAGTFGVSLLLYEYVLRRLKWIRPFFGMKLTAPPVRAGVTEADRLSFGPPTR